MRADPVFPLYGLNFELLIVTYDVTLPSANLLSNILAVTGLSEYFSPCASPFESKVA